MCEKINLFIKSSIAFCINYLVQIFFFYNIIYFPDSFFRVIEKDEWFWWLENYPNPSRDSGTLILRDIMNYIFAAIFIYAVSYILHNKKLRNAIGIRLFIFLVTAGGIVAIFCFIYFKYYALHYRLFMGTTYSAISAVILLLISLKAKKALCGENKHPTPVNGSSKNGQ